MNVWVLLLVALLAVLLLAWHLTYTAARLDRLHVRVEGSLSSLDAQLVRRAEVASEVGQSQVFDPASALVLLDAASLALEAAEDAAVVHAVVELGIARQRGSIERSLTEALALVCHEWEPRTSTEQELRRRLADACARVQLARRFHNEAVRDVRRVRARRDVRLFRLAGHTSLPQEVAFDDGERSLDFLVERW